MHFHQKLVFGGAFFLVLTLWGYAQEDSQDSQISEDIITSSSFEDTYSSEPITPSGDIPWEDIHISWTENETSENHLPSQNISEHPENEEQPDDVHSDFTEENEYISENSENTEDLNENHADIPEDEQHHHERHDHTHEGTIEWDMIAIPKEETENTDENIPWENIEHHDTSDAKIDENEDTKHSQEQEDSRHEDRQNNIPETSETSDTTEDENIPTEVHDVEKAEEESQSKIEAFAMLDIPLEITSPAFESVVDTTFTLSGKTAPHTSVHIKSDVDHIDISLTSDKNGIFTTKIITTQRGKHEFLISIFDEHGTVQKTKEHELFVYPFSLETPQQFETVTSSTVVFSGFARPNTKIMVRAYVSWKERIFSGMSDASGQYIIPAHNLSDHYMWYAAIHMMIDGQIWSLPTRTFYVPVLQVTVDDTSHTPHLKIRAFRHASLDVFLNDTKIARKSLEDQAYGTYTFKNLTPGQTYTSFVQLVDVNSWAVLQQSETFSFTYLPLEVHNFNYLGGKFKKDARIVWNTNPYGKVYLTLDGVKTYTTQANWVGYFWFDTLGNIAVWKHTYVVYGSNAYGTKDTGVFREWYFYVTDITLDNPEDSAWKGEPFLYLHGTAKPNTKLQLVVEYRKYGENSYQDIVKTVYLDVLSDNKGVFEWKMYNLPAGHAFVSAREYDNNREVRQISKRYNFNYDKIFVTQPEKNEIVSSDILTTKGIYLPFVPVNLQLNDTTVRVLCDENGVFEYTFPMTKKWENTLLLETNFYKNTFTHSFQVPAIFLTTPQNGTIIDSDQIMITGKNFSHDAVQIDIEDITTQTMYSQKVYNTLSSAFQILFSNLTDGKYEATAYTLNSNNEKQMTSQTISFTIQKSILSSWEDTEKNTRIWEKEDTVPKNIWNNEWNIWWWENWSTSGAAPASSTENGGNASIPPPSVGWGWGSGYTPSIPKKVEIIPSPENTEIPKKSETSIIPSEKIKEEVHIPENITKEKMEIKSEMPTIIVPTETKETQQETTARVPVLPTKKHHTPKNESGQFLADTKMENIPNNYIPEQDIAGMSVATDDDCHVLSRELEIPALRILSLHSGSRIEWDALPKAQAYHVYKKDALWEMMFVTETTDTFFEIPFSSSELTFEEFGVKAVVKNERCEIDTAGYNITKIQTGASDTTRELVAFFLTVLICSLGFGVMRKVFR